MSGMKIVKKFHRNATQRRFMFRHLTQALILHGQIKTTAAKAKELRRFADRVVNWSKRGTHHSRVQAYRMLMSWDIVKKLFDEMPSRFPLRPSGYSRVRLAGNRKGDNAEMAIIEWVEPDRPDDVLPAAVQASQKKKTEEL